MAQVTAIRMANVLDAVRIGWAPKTSLQETVAEIVEADLAHWRGRI
ncbi:hypothetical protein [Roseomonas sp. HF4]|nr:hypothetical protein [Roseomonas sp. HF4]